MKNIIIYFLWLSFIALCGCKCNDYGHENNRYSSPTHLLTFSWEYVTSKKILHDGHKIQMLKASILKFEDGKSWPNIVAVQYGKKDTSEIVYLDFYTVKQDSIGELSKPYSWAGLSLLPRVYFLEHLTLPPNTYNINITLKNQKNERWISIDGDYHSSNTGKTESYKLPYMLNKDFMMLEGLSSFWTEPSMGVQKTKHIEAQKLIRKRN